jgi:hypothetical protein
MNKCDYCHVTVDDSLKRCPLCFKTLNKKALGENSLYPTYDHDIIKKKRSLIFKLSLFASVAGIGVCTVVNLLAWPGYFWTTYVIVAIIYTWLLVKNTLMSKKHGGIKLLIQLVVVAAMLYIIDFLFGKTNWSVNIVIPFMLLSAITLILIMVLVKRMLWSDYIGYAIVIIFSGFAPLILYAIGVATLLWPSIMVAAYAGIVFLWMWLFRDKQFKSEFTRRFHF